MAIKHASKVKSKTVKIEGLEKVFANLTKMGVDVRKATVGALNDAALSIEQQATQLVPFDEGILAASSSIAEPKLTATSKSTSVGVRYGGPSECKLRNYSA